MGALANISIADFDPEKAEFDNSVPEITELYINSPETADGSVVAVASSVHALFAASNGLSLSDNKIGLTPTLILDGTTSFPDIRSYISPVDDSTMKLEMPLDGIDPGRHTLVHRRGRPGRRPAHAAPSHLSWATPPSKALSVPMPKRFPIWPLSRSSFPATK